MFPFLSNKITPEVAQNIAPLRRSFREKLTTLSLTISGATFAFLNLSNTQISTQQESVLKLSWAFLGVTIVISVLTEITLVRSETFGQLMDAKLPDGKKLGELKKEDEEDFMSFWERLFFWLQVSFVLETLSLISFMIGMILSFYFIITF